MRMRRVLWLALSLIVVAGIGAGVFGAGAGFAAWTSDFPVKPDELVSVGRNAYFVLEPGYTLILEGGGTQLIIAVLNETKTVDGVETRVVEERETRGGKPVEVARNYFAISKRTNDVFYFGEDVDMYKGGAVVNHDGSWLSGVNGGKFGLMMPGRALVGSRYYQGVAPNIAMDRARIVSVTETVKTPAGEFKNCVKVEETDPLRRFTIGLKYFTTDLKYYAPGIGMVSDGALKLVKVVRGQS